MPKPRVFIGSSPEGLSYARAVEEQLASEREPVLWANDVFALSRTTVESLEEALSTVEFAVLILTPDDAVTSRGVMTEAPRDNIVLELGLFMGRFGRERVFVIAPDVCPKLPTDLLGITVASFDSKRSDGNIVNATSPAASKVLRSIKSSPRHPPERQSAEYSHVLLDEERLLSTVASWPSSNKLITVRLPDTKWVWKLFPALLCWRLAETPVTVIASPVQGNPVLERQEHTRRKLLTNLGATVTESMPLGTRGVFRDAHYPSDTCAVVCSETTGDFEPFAMSYDGKFHTEAAFALMERAAVSCRTNSTAIPTLRPIDCEVVVQMLRKGVDQYAADGVRLTFESIPTKDLFLMSPYARSSKYTQIGKLYQEYQRQGVNAFEPMAVRLADGGDSIVTLPVVEIHDIGPVVIEGTTRATFCRNRGIAKYFCIKVEGVQESLPGTPSPITEVTITQRSLPPGERMKGFEYGHFRHIERAVHPY
jgi:hypothetical protein